jgi:demethylspheroidene O-methyltransferase
MTARSTPLAASPVPGIPWLDRALAWRDRQLASAGFRRWAAAFPLTRPIARRRTAALFDLCAGFVYAQVLVACVRLRLFDILAEAPLATPALAARLGLPPDATARLLDAAIALKLVARRGRDRVGLGPLGAALVGNGAVTSMIEHHAHLYDDLRDPVALLRGELNSTALSRYWPYAKGGHSAGAKGGHPASAPADATAEYTALMAASQSMIAAEVLDAFPLRGVRCLLDVGGGDGSFIAAAIARTPGLRAILFDLPPVADRARARFAAAGLDATAIGGSFRDDPLPTGADAISLIRVVHDHDDAVALALLRAARAALPKGGTLLLAEPMAATPGAEAVGAYFAIYLLAMGSGRPRSQSELQGMLRTAGFGAIRAIPTSTPLLTRLLVAKAA